jgi:glyoxylase-like metal-dependent hydrolase (beta-lactamase superfamily II)
MSEPSLRRVDFGYFVRPAQETGTGYPRVEALLGYAIVYPSGVLLFDTGLAEGDAEADARYKPVRRPLDPALREAGIDLGDVRWIANCHLHFDHCGGNPAFAGRPVFVQAVELETARTTKDYTLLQAIDFPSANYEELDGEREILPDTLLIPTPGHTNGHQVLALRHSDGTIILAGQAHQSAFDYGSEQLAWRAGGENQVHDEALAYQPWIDRLQRLDPRQVVFAHDYSIWTPASWNERVRP